MKSRLFALCVANLIPLLALGGAGASALLIHSLHEESRQSLGLATYAPSTWMSILACAITGIFCLCIALWWLPSLAIYYGALARSRQAETHMQLPTWVPSLLKTLAGASLGLGALAPAQAYVPPAEGAISVSTTIHTGETDSPLFPQTSQAGEKLKTPPDTPPLASAVSPFFTQAKGQAGVTVLSVSSTSYHPISPLFGGGSRVQQEPLGSNQQKATAPQSPATEQDHSEVAAPRRAMPDGGSANAYMVAPGDSLWSIAEDRLPAEASGADVLELVHTIWQLNQDTIPTLDTLIFPGQIITLPR